MAKPSASRLRKQAERDDTKDQRGLSMKYEFVPAIEGSRVDHVGSYRRRLPVSLERMYENTLDWQHLPHLHSSSFTSLAIETAGAWGWRASVMSGEDAGVGRLSRVLFDAHLQYVWCQLGFGNSYPHPGQGYPVHPFRKRW